VVSHDEAFVRVACDSIADVDGGRLQLYPFTPFDQVARVREERRQAARALVESQKAEEQRLLAVVSKWENVDRSKAATALKALDKLWPELEAAEALVISKRRVKLTLAKPPACGERPLTLEGADVSHSEGAPAIVRGVDFEIRRGQRIILRGPNGGM
jgi:ATPase subunit of ABC transporter with duplicated ATPase domains